MNFFSAGSDFTSQIFTEEFSRVDSVGVLKQGVLGAHTLHKKMKFSLKDFFSNWDQIRSFQIRKIVNIKFHFLCSDTEYSWKGLETHLCCCKTTNKLSRCWIDWINVVHSTSWILAFTLLVNHCFYNNFELSLKRLMQDKWHIKIQRTFKKYNSLWLHFETALS